MLLLTLQVFSEIVLRHYIDHGPTYLLCPSTPSSPWFLSHLLKSLGYCQLFHRLYDHHAHKMSHVLEYTVDYVYLHHHLTSSVASLPLDHHHFLVVLLHLAIQHQIHFHKHHTRNLDVHQFVRYSVHIISCKLPNEIIFRIFKNMCKVQARI